MNKNYWVQHCRVVSNTLILLGKGGVTESDLRNPSDLNPRLINVYRQILEILILETPFLPKFQNISLRD